MMKRLATRFVTARYIVVYIAFVTSVTAIVVAVGAIAATNEADENAYQRAVSVREGQIENCHAIGDPLVDAVKSLAHNQNQFARDQIEETRTTDYARLFPNIDPKELDRLLHESIEQYRGVIKNNQEALEPLLTLPPCEERYPEIPERP
jgi:hypothetical protein